MAAKPRELSSSDAESNSESELVQENRKRQHVKYQCPADFVACDFQPCVSTRLENVNNEDIELWLIKAPLTFNPDSFSGVRVPRMGLETVQPSTGQAQVYSVLSRPVATGDARLLTAPGQRSRGTLCAPAFSGIINICESYGDCQGNQAPIAIPACPAPTVPDGLRQRFQPFGSRTPSGRGSDWGARPQGEGLADSPTAAKRVKTDPEQGETPKKKNKKKKEKRMKEEMVEEEVSAAPSLGLTVTSQDTPPEPTPEEVAAEKKRKKKKKKSKDRDGTVLEESSCVVETGLSVKEEEQVKTEPLDRAYGDVESSGKKKKVKKEKRQTQD